MCYGTIMRCFLSSKWQTFLLQVGSRPYQTLHLDSMLKCQQDATNSVLGITIFPISKRFIIIISRHFQKEIRLEFRAVFYCHKSNSNFKQVIVSLPPSSMEGKMSYRNVPNVDFLFGHFSVSVFNRIIDSIVNNRRQVDRMIRDFWFLGSIQKNQKDPMNENVQQLKHD